MKTRILVAVLLLVSILMALAGCSTTPQLSESARKALAYIEEGKLTEAYEFLLTQSDADSKNLLMNFYFLPTNLEMENGETTTFKMTYDPNGNLLTEDMGSQKFVYTYGEKGNRLSEECIYPDQPEMNTNHTYQYDANGNCLTETWYHSDGTVSSQNKSTYDKNGNLTKKEEFTGDTLFRTYTYTYDENGRLLSQKQVFEESGEFLATAYTYDSNGNILREESSNSSGVNTNTVWTYDENGKVLSEVSTYIPNGSEQSSIYTYDENGNLLSIVYTLPTYGYRIDYTYDENGLRLTHSVTAPDHSEKQTFTYDAFGNLEKCEGFSDVTEFSYDRVNGTYTANRSVTVGGVQQDIVITAELDQYGNFIRTEVTSKQDPAIHATVNYTWQLCYCPNGVEDQLSNLINEYVYNIVITTNTLGF